MVSVTDHYDAYPYPARDPADEAKRLISGSPSQPIEMDHFLWSGQRDWSRPLRVLVAGGGSGDGLVQLAQRMTDAGKPYEITYLDLSAEARKIAQARVAARGLRGVTFHTASLLDAPDFGTFDYIDCCGVLHHLPDPDAGFSALAKAVAPDGGMGFMVYAPYGRSGVYPLQEAFSALLTGLSPQERVAEARRILAKVPDAHPFRRNTIVKDHESGDAGFYDLLLHGQDRAYAVTDLLAVLARTGWSLAGFCQSALYDPSRITGAPCDLDDAEAMAAAEKLRGTLKVHVGYATPSGHARPVANGRNRGLVPHLSGGDVRQLSRMVAAGERVRLRLGDDAVEIDLPKATAPLIAAVSGRRNLGEIAAMTGTDPIGMGVLWGKVEAALMPWGLLHYSGVLR